MESEPSDYEEFIRKILESIYLLSKLVNYLKIDRKNYELLYNRELNLVVFTFSGHPGKDFPVEMFCKHIENIVYIFNPRVHQSYLTLHFDHALKRSSVSGAFVYSFT